VQCYTQSLFDTALCVAAIFNCYTFYGYAANPFGTFAIPLRYTAKEPSPAQAQPKKTVIPTTTTIPL
jgi:hypothetical protein